MPLRHHPIAIGDQFVRTGVPDKIYTVHLIDERPSFPPHARLIAETKEPEQITIGLSALNDPKLFRRVGG